MDTEDLLELFLKLHSTIMDKEINECTEEKIRNIFIAEKELVISLVKFIRYLAVTDKDKLQKEIDDILETSEDHPINVDKIKKEALLYAKGKDNEESDRR